MRATLKVRAMARCDERSCRAAAIKASFSALKVRVLDSRVGFGRPCPGAVATFETLRAATVETVANHALVKPAMRAMIYHIDHELKLQYQRAKIQYPCLQGTQTHCVIFLQLDKLHKLDFTRLLLHHYLTANSLQCNLFASSESAPIVQHISEKSKCAAVGIGIGLLSVDVTNCASDGAESWKYSAPSLAQFVGNANNIKKPNSVGIMKVIVESS